MTPEQAEKIIGDIENKNLYEVENAVFDCYDGGLRGAAVYDLEIKSWVDSRENGDWSPTGGRLKRYTSIEDARRAAVEYCRGFLVEIGEWDDHIEST